METCPRCNGRGQLPMGWEEGGKTQYMRCEVCWGSGQVDPNARPRNQAGCVPVILLATAAVSSLALTLVWGVLG